MQSIPQRYARTVAELPPTRQAQPEIPIVGPPDAGIEAADRIQSTTPDQSLTGRLNPSAGQECIEDVSTGRRPGWV